MLAWAYPLCSPCARLAGPSVLSVFKTPCPPCFSPPCFCGAVSRSGEGIGGQDAGEHCADDSQESLVGSGQSESLGHWGVQGDFYGGAIDCPVCVSREMVERLWGEGIQEECLLCHAGICGGQGFSEGLDVEGLLAGIFLRG